MKSATQPQLIVAIQSGSKKFIYFNQILMSRFDIYKTISQTGDSLKQLSVFNPLTIHKKGTKAKAVFALALVCFLWGTTWVASKQGVRYMPALQLASIRQVIAGLCYVIFFLIKGAKLPKGKEWIPVLVLSFLNFVMSNGLTTWSVQYISAEPLWLLSFHCGWWS